jgi:hypothetical protein
VSAVIHACDEVIRGDVVVEDEVEIFFEAFRGVRRINKLVGRLAVLAVPELAT